MIDPLLPVLILLAMAALAMSILFFWKSGDELVPDLPDLLKVQYQFFREKMRRMLGE